MGLFTPERSIIITNLDAQTINLEPFQYTGAEIILFRITNPNIPFQEYKNIDEVLANERNNCEDYNNCSPEEIEGSKPDFIKLLKFS